MNRVRNSSSAQAPAVAVQVVVCFAVREEARFFLPPAKPVTASLITGMGARNASAAVQGYLSTHCPQLVLSCGFAGALNPVHPLGQVLFNDAHAGPFRNRLSRMQVQPGRFLHSDRVVVTAQDKKALFEASHADAVEMESTAIEAVCRERATPVIVLRVISDTAMEDLPLDFNRFMSQDGSLNIPQLLLGLATCPSAIPALMRFQANLNVAARSLAAALGRVLTSRDLF